MSFKRPLSISPSPEPYNCDKEPRKIKNLIKSDLCRVCGDKANVVNYGALSCQSCKTFFRRNGFHSQNARLCLSNNSCEVNMHTRRSCTACRLAKCFSVGMSSDFIRKEVPKCTKHSSSSNTNKRAVSKQVISVSQLLTSDEVKRNISLNNSEWALLANIVHAHDTFNTIPRISHLIERLSTLPIGTHSDGANESEIVALIYAFMQLFISSSPDFQILTTSEQHSLFERNLSVVAVFYFSFVFFDVIAKSESKYGNLLTTMYGSNIRLHTKRIDKQLLNDSIIVRLLLIIFTFSSNSFIVDADGNRFNDSLVLGTHRLLGSQNVYVELLWKYMNYRYGYYHSVLSFSRLLELFLSLIKYSSIAYRDNATYHQSVDNILKEVKRSLSTNHNKQIRLWGKS